MKKILVIILCIVFVTGGVISILSLIKKGNGINIEDVLRQGPMFYAKYSNVEENLNGFYSTQFWKGVSSIDYGGLMEKNNVNAKFISMIESIEKVFSAPSTRFLLNDFFGEEFALVFYPVDLDFSSIVKQMIVSPEAEVSTPAHLIEEAFSGLVVVTRIKPGIQFIEGMLKMFDPQSEHLAKDMVEYKKHTIHTLIVPEILLSFNFVKIEDLLIVSIKRDALKKCIDVFNKDKPSLLLDPVFQQAKLNSFEGADNFGYLNIGEFFSGIEDNILKFVEQNVKMRKPLLQKNKAAYSEENSVSGGDISPEELESAEIENVKAEFQNIISKMSGIKSVTFSSRYGEPVSKMKVAVFFNEDELENKMVNAYTCPPDKNRTLRFIPKRVLAYSWMNCFILEDMWEEVKEELSKNARQRGAQSTGDLVEKIEGVLMLNIEDDILAVFDDEIGGCLVDILETGIFPVPEFVFFFKIKDKDKAASLMGRLTEHPFLILQEEEYLNEAIHYIISPLGEEVQPSYCFLDDYLMIASNKKIIKSSIDAGNDESLSLASNTEFKEIDADLAKKNKAVQFIKIGDISRKLKNVVKWTNNWAFSREKKQEAFKSGAAKRMNDIKDELFERDAEIRKKKKNLAVLENGLAMLNKQGKDTTGREGEIKILNEEILVIQDDVESLRDHEKHLEEVISGYNKQAGVYGKGKIFLDGFIYPFLKACESIPVFSSRENLLKGVIEKTFSWQME